MSPIDFEIRSVGPVSSGCLERGLRTFREACNYITDLSYGRNLDKSDALIVFKDGCGTCSSKHALLARLALENQVNDIRLIMGLYKMNGANTPAVKATLAKHNLDHIPEAHNYLMARGQRIDCTKKSMGPDKFVPFLIEEIEITPDQIGDFKVNYHKRALEQWLQKESHIKFSIAELWKIREQCIADLTL